MDVKAEKAAGVLRGEAAYVGGDECAEVGLVKIDAAVDTGKMGTALHICNCGWFEIYDLVEIIHSSVGFIQHGKDSCLNTDKYYVFVLAVVTGERKQLRSICRTGRKNN